MLTVVGNHTDGRWSSVCPKPYPLSFKQQTTVKSQSVFLMLHRGDDEGTKVIEVSRHHTCPGQRRSTSKKN